MYYKVVFIETEDSVELVSAEHNVMYATNIDFETLKEIEMEESDTIMESDERLDSFICWVELYDENENHDYGDPRYKSPGRRYRRGNTEFFKVGDKVWSIYNDNSYMTKISGYKKPHQKKITQIVADKNGNIRYQVKNYHFNNSDIGEIIFSTKEEAEEGYNDLVSSGYFRISKL